MCNKHGIGLAVVALVFSLSGAAEAQWSEDGGVNLAISDRSGEQTQAKIVATSDGGAYVSWFDNSTGGYDVYLQRLDSGGTEQWVHNGVLIADRSFSSTQDYALAVDTAGNALLTFRDDRSGSVQITAAKISTAGTLVWGTNGVQLTIGGSFVAAPKIAGTTDGNVVVAWTNDSDVKLQKLDGSGAPQWGTGISIVDAGGGSYTASDLHESDGGSVIVSMVLGFGGQLYTQKLSPTGTAMWGPTPVNLFDVGGLQFGNFPTFVTDGAGGAVFTWYTTGPLQCFVQRITSAGAELFAHNGVATSTLGSQLRVSPSVSFNPATEETFVSWTELNTLQSQHGMYAQKLSAGGVRQWTDNGRVIVPVGTSEQTQARALAFGDGAMFFWVVAQGFGNQRVEATRLDSSGNDVWSPAIVEPSSLVSSKSRLAVARSANNQAFLAWKDGRNDAGDIYGQNVRADGSFGVPIEAIPTVSQWGMLALLLSVWGVGMIIFRQGCKNVCS